MKSHRFLLPLLLTIVLILTLMNMRLFRAER